MQSELSSTFSHVLFVDDDEDVLKAASLLLPRHGFRLTAARSPAQAWSVIASEPVDVILLDLNFTRGAITGEEGFRHLAEIITQDPDAVVVVVTGHSGVNIAVAAMRAGAADFVMKPWSNERLIATLQTALALRESRRRAAALAAENAALNAEAWGLGTPLLGESPAIQRVRDLIRRAAPTDAAVLIYGAAGTGKSLIARNIHLQSARAVGPFIPVDLGVLSADEAERALFGDGRLGGAAAGALIAAAGGSLFLDEIASLGAPLQARLLAALETGRIAGRDGERAIAMNVRLLSATRRRREDLHARGGLRDDLLYRLNTVEIFAPPLAARGEDAVLLAEHFLWLYARRHGRLEKALAPDARDAILQWPWIGDVRTLRQAMERAVIFAEGDRYELSDLPPAEQLDGSASIDRSGLNLSQSERTAISLALKRTGFNVSHAAKQLGLSRAALYRRMAKHGL